jgi:hypothetical protein
MQDRQTKTIFAVDYASGARPRCCALHSAGDFFAAAPSDSSTLRDENNLRTRSCDQWHAACSISQRSRLVLQMTQSIRQRCTRTQQGDTMKTNWVPLISSAVLLGQISTTSAHHAFAAEFDADKPIELKGKVTKVKWVNPHSWLFFDVVAADGQVTNWGVEFGAPNQLSGRGLKKADLPVGTPVQIKGYRSKNGGPFGYSVTLALADGRTFQTGGAQDGPGTAAATSSLQR